ncbi:MAG: hypothetical protein NTZ94_02415 [Verrucomicrobia bacterium]|nr:hypothetical protein [Verrucomicrobiota bacterium]
MKLPYSLLITTLTLSFALSTPSESLAFGGPPGGPFSNGSYFSNEGTFSAVVRGENLTGTLQFSTTEGAGAPVQFEVVDPNTGNPTLLDTNSGQGSTGVSTIYYDGDTFQGNSQGSLNSEASTMTVMFQADFQQQGQQEDIFVSEVIVGNINQREINYFDSVYLSGAANCRTSNAFPNQKFEGDGEAEMQNLLFPGGGTPIVNAIAFPISVSGVRLANTTSNFFVSDVQAPSVNRINTVINQ